MSPLKKKLLYIAFLCAFFLTSCVSLLTPQGHEVKTVALVSVSVNRIVHEKQDFPSEDGDYFNALKVDRKQMRKSARFVKSMVKHSASSFKNKFKGIKQWKLAPGRKVLSSKAYKKFSKKMKAHSRALLKKQKLSRKLFLYNFRTANIGKRKKMAFVPNAGLVEAEQKILAQLAKELGVDAVAVLDVDMAYEAEAAPNTFSAAAGVSLVMVGKDGQYALSTPPVRGGFDSPFRLKSDATVSFPKGKKVFNKKVYAMFKDSITGGIGEIAAKIQSELAQ